MCYRKETVFTRCWHTTTEDEDCEAKKRQTHLDHLRRLSGTPRRGSWLHFFFFCCFPAAYASAPRTPPPSSTRDCWLQDVAAEVDGVCPRCRLLRAQERAVVDRGHRYDHESAARRRASAGRGGGVDAFADPSCGQEREADSRMRDAERYGESGRRSRRGYRQEDEERIRAPERTYRPYRLEESRGRNDETVRSPRRPARDFVPYVDPPAPVAALSPRQVPTSHLRPAPLQVSNVKQNEDLSGNKDKSNNHRSPRKPGRSAVGSLQNPPMSVLVENVEKTWSREQSPPAAAAAAAAAVDTETSSRHAPALSPAPYTPELPVEELIDEVELMWQMSTRNIGSGRS